MTPTSNSFRRSLMGRSATVRLAAVASLLVLLWLAIAWAVSLP
ncbi:MAG: hypothetical protein ABWY49_12315 [Rhizobium sp.]